MDVIPHNTIIVSPIHKPFAIMDIQAISVHIASCYVFYHPRFNVNAFDFPIAGKGQPITGAFIR